MTKHSEIEVERQALELPEARRLRLAARLLSSIESSALSDQEALRLAEERARELDEGKVEALDYHQEMQRIRKTLTP